MCCFQHWLHQEPHNLTCSCSVCTQTQHGRALHLFLSVLCTDRPSRKYTMVLHATAGECMACWQGT